MMETVAIALYFLVLTPIFAFSIGMLYIIIMDRRRARSVSRPTLVTDCESTEPFPRPFLVELPPTVLRMYEVMNNHRRPMKSSDIAVVSKVNKNTVRPNLSNWKVGNKKGNPGVFVYNENSGEWSLSEYGPPLWRADED